MKTRTKNSIRAEIDRLLDLLLYFKKDAQEIEKMLKLIRKEKDELNAILNREQQVRVEKQRQKETAKMERFYGIRRKINDI